MFTSKEPVNPFLTTDEMTGDAASIWILFSHTGIYITAIGSLIPAGLGIFVAIFFGANLPD